MRTIVVPPSLLDLAVERGGLVSHRQCDEAGLRRGARTRLVESGRWFRVNRGVYLIPGLVAPPATVSQEWSLHHRRQVWAALLARPDDAVPVGLTALALHGLWGLPRNLGCEVTYGSGRRAAGPRGVRVRQFRPFETTVVGGRVVPTIASALVQALPEVGRDLAVVLLDNALHRRLLLPAELPLVRDGVRGRRGAAHLHAVWPLVDGRAESPIETRARLECLDDGIPADDLQVELVDDDGRFLGRGDIGFRHRDGGWVVAELDGLEEHDRPRALSRDRRRQNDVVNRSSTRLLRFEGKDLGTGIIPRDVRLALRRPLHASEARVA